MHSSDHHKVLYKSFYKLVLSGSLVIQKLIFYLTEVQIHDVDTADTLLEHIIPDLSCEPI